MTKPRVLFVCLHGAAKSVVAAELLSQLAAARGLDVVAHAAGIEPDAEIAPGVVEALRAEGIDVRGRRPVGVTAEAVATAHHVVSFDCDLGSAAAPGMSLTIWHDVPAVSDGYAAARAAIVERLELLIEQLRPTALSDPAEPC